MTAHGSMHDRDRTDAQDVLREAGVTYDDIAALSGVPRATVHRYLASVRGQESMRYGAVMRIRSAAYAALLRAERPDLTDALFAQHDQSLQAEILQELEKRPAGEGAPAAAVH